MKGSKKKSTGREERANRPRRCRERRRGGGCVDVDVDVDVDVVDIEKGVLRVGVRNG